MPGWCFITHERDSRINANILKTHHCSVNWVLSEVNIENVARLIHIFQVCWSSKSQTPTAQCHWWEWWAACRPSSPRLQRTQSKPVGRVGRVSISPKPQRPYVLVSLVCTDSPSPERFGPCRSGRCLAWRTEGDSSVALWRQYQRESCSVPGGENTS